MPFPLLLPVAKVIQLPKCLCQLRCTVSWFLHRVWGVGGGRLGVGEVHLLIPPVIGRHLTGTCQPV